MVELEKTKADNVKLYGKIRYVQDYSLEKLVSRGSKKVASCNFLSVDCPLCVWYVSCPLLMYDCFSIQKMLKVDSVQMLNQSTRRYMKMT